MSAAPQSRKPLAFVAIHLAVLLLGCWLIARTGSDPPPQLPRARAVPLQLTPLYDDPAVVSDEDLARVLSRIGLRQRGPATRLGTVDHTLRLWGGAASFADPGFVSGPEMLGLVTDHRRFIATYGTERDPLLDDRGADRGVHVRAFAGPASSTHIDHTLASLAEIGLPLDFPVVTPERVASLADLVVGSLRGFSLNQSELEWSALTYALFLEPNAGWVTTEGQEVTFDSLARRLMREDLSQGVCSANHRFHALVAFERVDDLLRERGEGTLLDAESRDAITEFLRRVTELFARHQHPDGFWNDDWPRAVAPDSQPSAAEGDRLADRIIVTGHVLEWWALAPAELQPPREVVTKAAHWLVTTIDRLSSEQIAANLTFLTHSARALALWRGRLPSEEFIREASRLDNGSSSDTVQ